MSPRIVVGFLLLLAVGCRSDPLARAPALFVRASDLAEDFRFLRGSGIGIVIPVATARVENGTLEIQARKASLMLPDDKPYLLALYRLEVTSAQLDPQLRARIAADIANRASEHFLRAVQLEFWAEPGQRDWYRALLGDLRNRLAGKKPLTITAPPSWCHDPAWAASLPVDEIVPWHSEPATAADVDYPVTLCNWSLGVSTAGTGLHTRRRMYLDYTAGSWNANAVGVFRTNANSSQTASR